MRICRRLRAHGHGAKEHGFTLIELLVVMAIISVLASILFPAFARARGAARQISCASNLRQCAIALRMYRDDNDDGFPPQNLYALSGITGAGPRHVTGPEDAIWVGQLRRYLGTSAVMRCLAADTSSVDKLNDVPFGMGLNVQLTYLSSTSG